MATTLKGPGAAQHHDGSSLRIAIVHARWNTTIIGSLLSGIHKSLSAAGVPKANVVTQTVPGSYELPLAVQRVYQASSVQSATSGVVSATDLLASLATTSPPPTSHDSSASTNKDGSSSQPFDAIIAVGCLIKGETMHFEYIADAVSHGLMRVQIDLGVPVIFGLLTVLTEEQAMQRAGLVEGKMHNHGEDWGSAAVELGVKRRAWAKGEML